MVHLEQYILKLYESKKHSAGIKLGINRFSPRKRIIATILLIALIPFMLTFGLLMFLFPNSFWFLCGLIPCIIIMIILVIMDGIDQKEHIATHVKEYTKKIDLLYNLLVEDFHIRNKDQLQEVISMFQEYVNAQDKQEQKINKIVVAVFTSLTGVLTTSLANLEAIGIGFADWLIVMLVIFIIVGVVSMLTYMIYYITKNIYAKKEKYEAIINDLKYIRLCKY